MSTALSSSKVSWTVRAAWTVLLLALLTVAARADDVTELSGLVRQKLSLALPDQASQSLEALVIRPEGRGPFPLALITWATA